MVELLVRRQTSNKLGTHYGLFVGGFLIHYEFSRSSAEKVLDKIKDGEILYDIFFNEIKMFHVEKLPNEIECLKSEIKKLKKEILKEKAIKEKSSSTNKSEASKPKTTTRTRRKKITTRKKVVVPKVEKTIKKESVELKKISKSSIKEKSGSTNKAEDIFSFSPTKKLKSNFEKKIPEIPKAVSLAQENNLSKIESEELLKLITDMKAMNFSSSGDLSNYIKRNKLGHKYPNISGIVTMTSGRDTWNFEGGFPSKIYAIVCKELQLKGKGTFAQVVGFKPYKDL